MMSLGLQEVTFRLRTMGPVDIHQAKEHRAIKVGRTTCINALKEKRNDTEHVSRLQQEVGKGENGESSRARIRTGLVSPVKEFGLDLEGDKELLMGSYFQHESDMIRLVV